VPLLIDGFERHSHRRCPRLPALQLSCLSSGRSLEGEIADKRTELQEQSALAYWPIWTALTQEVPTAPCAPVIVFQLLPRIGRRDSRKTNWATRAKCPCLLTDLNATHTGGARGTLCSSYRVWALVAHWKARYRKNELRYKSKVPLLIDRFELHSHRRCPRPPALQLSCLSSCRSFEGEIQPKNKLSYKSNVPLLIHRFERHTLVSAFPSYW
jgi:hypothetical protein